MLVTVAGATVAAGCLVEDMHRVAGSRTKDLKAVFERRREAISADDIVLYRTSRE